MEYRRLRSRGLFTGIAVLLGLLSAGLGPIAVAKPSVFAFVDVHSDFALFDTSYSTRHKALTKQATALKQQVFALEQAGQPMICAHQVLAEVSWRLSSTADWPIIEGELDQLARLVAHPETDRAPDDQNPIDGSWGRCLTAWFFRLDASYNRIADLAATGKAPLYPTHFLDRINDPERLREYLSGVAA